MFIKFISSRVILIFISSQTVFCLRRTRENSREKYRDQESLIRYRELCQPRRINGGPSRSNFIEDQSTVKTSKCRRETRRYTYARRCIYVSTRKEARARKYVQVLSAVINLIWNARTFAWDEGRLCFWETKRKFPEPLDVAFSQAIGAVSLKRLIRKFKW